MRGGTLNSSTTDRNVDFDCCSIVSTCKSLFFGLSTSHYRNGKEIFVSLSIDLKNLMDESVCFFLGSMSSVAFLPKELSCSDERGRVLELPSNDIGPLIEQHGKVPM